MLSRLTGFTLTGVVSAGYLYDPMDRQSQKDVGGTKTRFIYNGLQRIAEYDGTAGTLNTRFVYATGLDEPVVEVSAGGTKTFFHRDRLGSIIARTDNSGAVTQRYAYGPFGESAVLVGTSFGFTGQRYDAESSMYYYKARYYSQDIGRFVQPDVIGYADGLNLYSYAQNQPLNFVDSLGLASDGGEWHPPMAPPYDGPSDPSLSNYGRGLNPYSVHNDNGLLNYGNGPYGYSVHNDSGLLNYGRGNTNEGGYPTEIIAGNKTDKYDVPWSSVFDKDLESHPNPYNDLNPQVDREFLNEQKYGEPARRRGTNRGDFGLNRSQNVA